MSEHKDLVAAQRHNPKDHNHTATEDGGILTAPEVANYIQLTNVSAPSAPASGKSRLFVRTSDKALCWEDSAGAVYAASSILGTAGQPWLKLGASVLVAACGNGDPRWPLGVTSASLAPSSLTTSVARIIKFRLPFALAVTDVFVYGVGTLNPAFSFAIYPVGTATSVTWSLADQALTANTWLDMSVSFSLAANTDYWMCVATTSSSGTTSLRMLSLSSGSINAAFFGDDSSAPFGGLSIGIPTAASFAVTAGAFPGTLPSITAAALAQYPMAWLKGTAS